MHDPEYDIHPLDRDYSSPAPPPRTIRERSPEQKLRHIGVIVFGVGFVLVLVAAFLLGTFRGTGWIESFGSVMHRLAMFAILAGGVVILASYRFAAMVRGAPAMRRGRLRQEFRGFAVLLVANVVGFVVLSGMIRWMTLSRASLGVYLTFSGMLTVLMSLLVTMIIWHRGMLRAYAVGALVALLTNGLLIPFILNPQYATRRQGDSLVPHLLSIPVSGLVCAGYVGLMFPLGVGGESEIASRRRSGPRPASPGSPGATDAELEATDSGNPDSGTTD